MATPTIDILAAVTSPEGIDTRVKRLCERGDTTSRQFNATLEARRPMRGKDGQRTHHLHTVSHDGHTCTERLPFRDALLDEPALARRRAVLRTELLRGIKRIARPIRMRSPRSSGR